MLRYIFSGVCIGVLLREWCNWSYPGVMFLALLALVLTAVFLRSVTRTRVELAFIITVIASGVSLLLSEQMKQSYEQSADVFAPCVSERCTLIGTVSTPRDERFTGDVFVVNVATLQNTQVEPFAVYVKSAERLSATYGDTLSCSGEGVPLSSFLSDTGRIVSYEDLLAAQNIHGVLAVRTCTIMGSVSSYKKNIIQIRETLSQSLARVIAEPESGLARGMVFGESHALSPELQETFRVTGLSHITVFSGANIMLFVICVWFLTGWLSYTPRILATCLSICVITFASGMSAPAVRAGLMAGTVFGARLLGRTFATSDVFFLTLSAMILYNPLSLLHDVSFQLSALATGALVFYARSFERSMEWVPHALREVTAMTVAILCVVSPWVAYTFGTFSVVSLFANIAVSFFIGAASLLSLTTALLSAYAPVLSLLCAVPAELCLRGIVLVADFCAHVPYAAIQIPPFHGGIVALYYAIFVFSVRRSSETQLHSFLNH